MTDEEPAPKPRSRRIYVYWGIALALVVTLGIAGWLIASVVTTGRTAARYARGHITAEQAVSALGGADEAVSRAVFYLNLPDWAAPKKVKVWILLARCGEPAVPFLLESLESTDAERRRHAFSALCCLDVSSRAVIAALTKTLSDEDKWTRYEAAEALGNMGSDARGSSASLRALFADPDGKVRVRALLAYYQVTGDVNAVIPGFAKAVSSADPGTAGTAAAFAADLGPSGARLTPQLIKALGSPHPGVRFQAVGALGRLRAKSAVPALKKLQASSSLSPLMRNIVSLALRRIRSKSE